MPIVDFEKVARDNYAAVYARALKMTRDSDWAGDLAQTTFERCLRALPRHLPEDRIRAWLFVVVRNLFLDTTRSVRFRWTTACDVADTRTFCLDDAPERPRWELYSTDDVHQALKSLPDHLRRPYEMHVLAGRSYAEIAGLLQLTVGTVGTRINRAKHQLRRRLTERWGAPGSGALGRSAESRSPAGGGSHGRALEMDSRRQESRRGPFDQRTESTHQAVL